MLHPFPRSLILALMLTTLLTACWPVPRRLRQDQVLDITWAELRPSTSSQTRKNWEYVDADRVYGREVVNEFSSLQVSNCPGPQPPENNAIRSSSEYWFVRVVPGRVLDPTPKSAQSSTPDSVEPEPLFLEAQFLIDPFSGEIIARRYVCDVE
jgi:hypothetical protein